MIRAIKNGQSKTLVASTTKIEAIAEKLRGAGWDVEILTI